MNSSGPEKRKKTNENIQVYVRVRPTNTREKSLRSNEIVDVVLPKELVIKQSLDGRITKKFTFDRTFGPNCKQNEVYTTVVAPLIEEVLGGYSCTVFAYGQTGTGKTYTMVGNEEPKLSASSEDDDITGIIPRSLSHLFDDLRMMGVEFSMRISYLELYNEELCDLLSTDDSIKIRIFDDAQKKGSVIIQNLEEIPVHCKNDVYKLLAKGQERRKTAATLMNAQSSRSHTVFSILVHIKETNDDGEEMVRTGKLNLVDLAGSENISKSGNEKGIRARETVNINQSLLTLGRVITALVEKGPHIPYRESKLTRILQESLGGRTKTSIIATISPGHKDIEETLSTLEYAHRAKNIENRPEVNQRLTKRTVLKEYTEEIDRLKRELMAARDKNGIFLPDDTYNEMMFKMESQAKELNDKMMLMKALKEELQQKESLFEKGVLALNIRTEELKRTEHSLNVVQTELDVTRKALRTTKRRYDEKSVVLSKHVETEAVLTNQAKELIQVAETASADTYGLREAIERRKKTEEENMSKLENFATDFNSNTAAVKQHLSELLSCHKENISKITQKLDANNNEHKVFCELIQKFIDEILAVQQSSYEKIQTLTDKNHGDLEQMSANNLGSISLQFKEIIDLNIKQTNDIFSKLESIKKLNSITNSLIIDTNSHLIEKINKSTKVMHDKVTTTMDTLSSSCSANQQLVNTESNSMTNIVNSNISMTATQKEFIEKSIDNLNQILTLVNSTTTNNAQLLNKVNVVKTSIENTTKVQTENIAEVKKFVKTDFLNSAADITEDCVAYKDKLLTDNENFIDELDEMNDMLKYNDDVNDIAHKNLANIKQSKMIFSSRVIEGSNLIKQHIKQSKGDLDKRSKERCNDISVEQERSIKFASACKQENDEALTHVSNYVDCIQNNIITCEENYESLHKKDMKKYLSTGQTPAGKEFNINRKLAATSPDKVIIRRYRQERASNRDLCSSTVSEQNDENSVPDMPNVTLDDSIVFSTPIKGEPKREDPKMFLKELQVSQIMNKANDTE